MSDPGPRDPLILFNPITDQCIFQPRSRSVIFLRKTPINLNHEEHDAFKFKEDGIPRPVRKLFLAPMAMKASRAIVRRAFARPLINFGANCDATS